MKIRKKMETMLLVIPCFISAAIMVLYLFLKTLRCYKKTVLRHNANLKVYVYEAKERAKR